MYDQLVAYKQQHGHCNVTRRGGDPYPKLGKWVARQRTQYKNQVKGYKENEERYIALNEIGFVFSPDDQAWSKMYEELVAYKQQYGDCIVSRTGKNKKLGMWVKKQRKSFNTEQKGYRVNENRYMTLDNIGFVFDKLDLKWSLWYKQLVRYQQQHGDCNVNQRGDNKNLGMWVSTQRTQYKNQVKGYKENEERYIALNEIGFIFNLADQIWSEMYEQLVAYKQQHGDCKVSRRTGDNLKLGEWVHTQEKNYTKQLKGYRVNEHRYIALNKIGCV